ncbi:sigma-70 family RNA polymerase sigma factor [Arthrobacter sp. ISL-95]|uniref:sigma-70 family RNA polymerase sigma factor n=1 Tax=Arthrobacter sp. ISL-95 TaxID=2819116 RepID=UPI001BEB9BBD|nr:sigma-70 family RNA polymerase sigma factor [Arthrobacter sp. ISL-95]MBT2587335.1 sigma-70 family RNA polymerase sigma factor [Arthrobacter sp. ISL-95]
MLNLIRAGQLSAFAELFRRYRNLAAYVARVESDNPSDMDDVVGEAFASVFQALAVGRGPSDSFRAYLLTAVRRTAHRRNVQARRVGFLSDVPDRDRDDGYVDPYLHALEPSSLIEAFRSLPARWQAVLWYSEVETMKPASVARIMDMTPNSVSALLIRARKGLRQAYLQGHVVVTSMDSCAEVSQHFGKYVLSDGRAAGSVKIRRHVDGCSPCAMALAALHQMRSAMKGSG